MAAVWFIVLTTLSNMSELCLDVSCNFQVPVSLCFSHAVCAARHNAQSVSNLPITARCAVTVTPSIFYVESVVGDERFDLTLFFLLQLLLFSSAVRAELTAS